MRNAEVGDSMRGDDPTINRLEELAAEKIRKEAAIFVPSGTMGNLVCLMAHTRPGDEVIFEANAHIYYYEVGGFAAVAGLAARTVSGEYGVMAPEDIEAALRPSSPYFPPPRLLCIENTHNRGFGNAIRPVEVEAMAAVARKHGLAVHIDGARIFNAAIALGVGVEELTGCGDSVQFCLATERCFGGSRYYLAERDDRSSGRRPPKRGPAGRRLENCAPPQSVSSAYPHQHGFLRYDRTGDGSV